MMIKMYKGYIIELNDANGSSSIYLPYIAGVQHTVTLYHIKVRMRDNPWLNFSMTFPKSKRFYSPEKFIDKYLVTDNEKNKKWFSDYKKICDQIEARHLEITELSTEKGRMIDLLDDSSLKESLL